MSRLQAILVIITLGLIKLLRPVVVVRFGKLFVSRLGHLAGNTECYLCERDAGVNRPKRVLDIWVPQGRPANEQLFKMYRRKLRMSSFGATLDNVGAHVWQNTWREHQFTDEQWGRDIHNLLEKYPPHIGFTRRERKRGEAMLRELGIPEGAKWVCIIGRDSMYLKAMEPAQDYDYHSFRDSNIQNYRQAAYELMNRGYYVLRMGRFVNAPMRLTAPMFIDYACHPMRCDFLDVYLGSKCAFTISNGTGFDGIPMVFRRPICFVNEAPFEYLSTWMKDSLAIWKHHEKDGKRMTPAEIVKSGAGLFHRTEQFEKAGIKLVENTPEEIKDAALEMLEPPKWREQQAYFWATYPRSKSPHNGLPLHGEIRLRIGTKFLEGYDANRLQNLPQHAA